MRMAYVYLTVYDERLYTCVEIWMPMHLLVKLEGLEVFVKLEGGGEGHSEHKNINVL